MIDTRVPTTRAALTAVFGARPRLRVYRRSAAQRVVQARQIKTGL